MCRLNTQLYWILPGPSDFAATVAEAVAGSRLTVINLPYEPPQGLWSQILHGAKGAHFDEPVHLRINEGASIEAEVGAHVDPERAHISAHRLATTVLENETLIMLEPKSEIAQQRCERYVSDFFANCEAAAGEGNCRLLVTMHERDLPEGRVRGAGQVIRFDGTLDEATMHAFVTLCMNERRGPGSTALLQAIVSAFAGFDPAFASRLMALDESSLLNIRSTLGSLFDEAPERWRTRDWLRGTHSDTRDNSIVAHHALHDHYLSRHGAPEVASEAARRLDKRYWRACVRAIIPWLEERRMAVLGPFKDQLRERSQPSGMLQAPIGKDRTRDIEPEEVEYNQLTAMVAFDGLQSQTPAQRQALSVARAAKRVRDEIAHVRAPSVEILTDLIRQMDTYCLGRS